MNKKGVTISLKVVVGLIIAALGIMILVGLLVALSGLIIGDAEKEQAKGTLNMIISSLNSMKNGESSFLVYSPSDWYILGVISGMNQFDFFGKKYDFVASSSCTGNCLCICKMDSNVLNCAKRGVCRQINYPAIQRENGNYKEMIIYISGGKSIKIINVFIDAAMNSGKGAYVFSLDSGAGQSFDDFFGEYYQFETWKLKRDNPDIKLSDEEMAYNDTQKLIKNKDESLTLQFKVDNEKKIFSHIVSVASKEYNVNHQIILGIINAESGLLSRESSYDKNMGAMGVNPDSLSTDKEDRLCRNDSGIREAVESTPNINQLDKSNALNDADYLRFLNEIACGTKTLGEVHYNLQNNQQGVQVPAKLNIGGMEISPKDDETKAIYYYLYLRGRDDMDSLDKIKRFIDVFSYLKKQPEVVTSPTKPPITLS